MSRIIQEVDFDDDNKERSRKLPSAALVTLSATYSATPYFEKSLGQLRLVDMVDD